MCWTDCGLAFAFLTPCGPDLFTEASVVATPEEAALLFHKQQGNELYTRYLLQDAASFLPFVPVRSVGSPTELGGSSCSRGLIPSNHCVKKGKKGDLSVTAGFHRDKRVKPPTEP